MSECKYSRMVDIEDLQIGMEYLVKLKYVFLMISEIGVIS